MQESVIHEDKREHGFGNRCGPDPDAGIMAAVGFNRDRIALLVDRLARDADTRRGLDADRHNDVLACRDTPENPAGVIRDKAFGCEFVAMF